VIRSQVVCGERKWNNKDFWWRNNQENGEKCNTTESKEGHFLSHPMPALAISMSNGSSFDPYTSRHLSCEASLASNA